MYVVGFCKAIVYHCEDSDIQEFLVTSVTHEFLSFTYIHLHVCICVY